MCLDLVHETVLFGPKSHGSVKPWQLSMTLTPSVPIWGILLVIKWHILLNILLNAQYVLSIKNNSWTKGKCLIYILNWQEVKKCQRICYAHQHVYIMCKLYLIQTKSLHALLLCACNELHPAPCLLRVFQHHEYMVIRTEPLPQEEFVKSLQVMQSSFPVEG